MVFRIPTLNPFPFYNPNLVVDARYNNRAFDDKVGEDCYVIKRQRTDTAVKMQILSDYPTVDFNFYVAYTEAFALNVPFTAIGIPITGATFKGYEATIDFSNLAEDIYYGEITYIDENSNLITYRTPLIDVKNDHPDTILFEYTDVVNRLGVIFDTKIEFNFRVEGILRNYQPSSSDEDYVDQKYNSISLNSIPYRIFDLYIGAFGIQQYPDWLIEKLNWIFACKLKSIEGTYYNKADGAKFELTRPTQKDDRGYPKITVIQDENLGIQEYKTGDEPIGDLIVVRKSYKVGDNITTNQSIAGVFTDNTTLCRIDLWNYDGDAFTLTVDDGTDTLGEFEIDGTNLTEALELVKIFNSPKTLNLTGITGANLKIFLVYDKLDAPVLNPVGGDGGYLPKTIHTYYEENAGDVNADWNISTGMGAPDTQFEGCVMLDGRNGTQDLTDLILITWDRANPALLQTEVGSNQVTLVRDNLPAKGLEMFVQEQNDAPGDIPTPTSYVAVSSDPAASNRKAYEMKRWVANPPNIGLTANMGASVPIDITPKGLYVLRFIKPTA